MSGQHFPHGSVVLVDEQDTPIGTMPKLQAHQEGRLHRAFSVFVLNDEGELLLQRRSAFKYHSPGLWTNTCCSHPWPGEATRDAAVRRLQEEMGFRCALEQAFSFVYRADVGQGLIEHELDHVFIGHYTGPVVPDPAEVAGTCWMHLDELHASLRSEPHRYTAWLPICWDRFREHMRTLAR